MRNWIDIIAPYTSDIKILSDKRKIILFNPHWTKDKSRKLYRELIKAIRINPYLDYTVEAIGFATLQGKVILVRLKQIIDNMNNVDYAKLKTSLSSDTYTLIVKFK